MSRVKTQPSTSYDPGACMDLLTALASAFARYGDATPSVMQISADIEWSGSFNPQAHRTTTMDDLRLSATRAAVEHAMDVAAPRPTHKGWHAQIRELTRTKAGYRAADTAGLSPSLETLKSWLANPGTEPSKANRARIEKASMLLHFERTTKARDRAAQEAADALSVALLARYGAEIRFRNITGLEFG